MEVILVSINAHVIVGADQCRVWRAVYLQERTAAATVDLHTVYSLQQIGTPHMRHVSATTIRLASILSYYMLFARVSVMGSLPWHCYVHGADGR